MTTQAVPRVRWLAPDAAGIGHAQPAGSTRTACGEPAIDERHAWPVRARCAICSDAIARLTAAKAQVA